jgi:hypothetical protein
LIDKNCFALCYAYCVAILCETGGLGLVACTFGCMAACTAGSYEANNLGGGDPYQYGATVISHPQGELED